jgi:ABC-type protease/lipase transport system fused ATPase/permease subunit
MTTGEARETVYTAALRGLRGPVVLVAVFSAPINLLMLTGPVYMLQVYDRVLSSGSVATLLGLFAIVVVLYEFLCRRLLSRAALRLDAPVGEAAVRIALRPGAGDARPERELETIRGFLSGGAITGLFHLPWTPLFVGLPFLIHSWLGVLTLAGAARCCPACRSKPSCRPAGARS